MIDFSNSNWLNDYNKLLDSEYEKSHALGSGVKVGKLFNVAVADGLAHYEIIRVNKKTVRVKWREDLATDGYKDWNLGDEGTIEISIVEPRLAYQEKLEEIIKKQKQWNLK